MPDKCPHRAAELSRGRVINNCLECPYHGLLFNKHGRCEAIPANGYQAEAPKAFDSKNYIVKEAHGLVWFWHGEDCTQYPEIPWFPEHPTDSGSVVVRGNDMNINSLRVMENVVDAHHVAFVHRNFGFGRLTYVDHYHAELDGDSIKMSAELKPDPHKYPYSKQTFDFKSTILFPCLVAIDFTDKLRVIAAAVPIDDENTWVYTAYAQNYLTWPVIGPLFTWLAYKFDWDLLQRYQDLPIWQSQQLDNPDDISQYQLFKADKAIALFFREYERRKN